MMHGSTSQGESGSQAVENQENLTNPLETLEDERSIALLRYSVRNPPSLRNNMSRNSLVKSFFGLTKSVLDRELSTERFLETKTYKKLESEVEYHIDEMNNGQLINLLASAIKMKLDPTSRLVKLLEHEVKFRLTNLKLSHAYKLYKFYTINAITSEQKHLKDMLAYRMKTCIQSRDTNLRELVDIYESLPEDVNAKNHLALLEEGILDQLTKNTFEDEDDLIVSRYINRVQVNDYETLCLLFIKMAEVGRRSPPILKAAAGEFCQLPMPMEGPNSRMIISVLASLDTLSYPNRNLIGKLTTDLAKVLHLAEYSANELCNLIRVISSLRWRHPELLNMIYEYINDNTHDQVNINQDAVITLLHCTAVLNFRPIVDLKEFYKRCLEGTREESIDKLSRKWLNYVWTLISLNVGQERHLKSVLSDEYINSLADKLSYSDKAKLLNLYSIATHEFKLDSSPFKLVQQFKDIPIQKGSHMLKFSQKVADAMSGLLKSSDWMIRDIATPHGFMVDGEIHLNDELEIIEPQEPRLASLLSDSDSIDKRPANCHRCALIHVSYDETVSNNVSEPVGHKKMISRILEHYGYFTVYLPETLINREKTSADLCNRIKSMIEAAVKSRSDSQ